MRKLLLLALIGVSLAYYRLLAGPMDGTAWDVKVKPEAFFSFSHKDTLIFKRGRLTASGYEASGFLPGAYNAQRVGGDVDAIWNGSLQDARRGTMTWHGLVRGDRMEGVAILWGKDGKSRRFTFTGKKA